MKHKTQLEERVAGIIKKCGEKYPIKAKKLLIGERSPISAEILFIPDLVNQDVVDRDILNPLMLKVNENLPVTEDMPEYISQRYIPVSQTSVENEDDKIAGMLKQGKAAIIFEKLNNSIVIDAYGAEKRNIEDAINEQSLKGTRESFVDELDTNLSLIRRRYKDKNLSVERFVVGRRSQTELALVYVDDIVNRNLLSEVKERIQAIDTDVITGSGQIEQFIEKSPLTIFPQVIATERPDRVVSKISEGRIAILLNGTPFVLTLPALFFEFFHAVEDYYDRTIAANLVRLLRLLAVFTVLTLSSIYLTLIKFNSELIPIDFVVPIVQSRSGITLSPFVEIIFMELLVEFLREGGLRLPTKIAQTLSIVGGIIISDAAVNAKIVSPTTLLIIGITTVASFLIPNNEMSLSIRILRFPLLLLANTMGIFGIAVGYIFLMVHMSSLDSFGSPYMSFYWSDIKDIFFRYPIWKMELRPSVLGNRDNVRQDNTNKKGRKK